jgi:hypothetical protein
MSCAPPGRRRVWPSCSGAALRLPLANFQQPSRLAPVSKKLTQIAQSQNSRILELTSGPPLPLRTEPDRDDPLRFFVWREEG